jgi:CubicO group peptidase (beta-lactamase class C family)
MKIQFFILVSLILSTTSCKNQKIAKVKSIDLRDHITPNKYPNIDGIIVSKDGKIIVEEYFNGFKRDTLHQTRSSFKSITSLLVGIAVDQKLFKVDDEIEKYISEWKDDPRGKIKVKDLLEMKSGLACENFFDVGPDCESEMYDTDDWLSYILDIPLRYEPGLKWEYTSMEPDLLGIIISRTSNLTLIEFASKYLFEPIGIKHCEWEITPEGRGYAAGSSYMKPVDMLKIAQLVKNNGNWNGRQIVSKEWINESTYCKTKVEMSFLYWSGIKDATYTSATYGYLWYRELLEYKNIKTEILFASGNGGQYMMILEDYNTAIVFTGSNYGNWRGKLPFEILLKYIIPELEKEK